MYVKVSPKRGLNVTSRKLMFVGMPDLAILEIRGGDVKELGPLGDGRR